MADVSALMDESMMGDDELESTIETSEEETSQEHEEESEDQPTQEADGGDDEAAEQEEGESKAPVQSETAPAKASEPNPEMQQMKQALGLMYEKLQATERQLQEFKQPKQEAAAPKLPQGFDEQKWGAFSEANEVWFQNTFGMNAKEVKQKLDSLSESQSQVIGETNQRRADAHLQERVKSLGSELKPDEIQALSQEARVFYANDEGKPIADMDPMRAWNIPPDLAMKAALGERYLKEKRHTATEQSKARDAKKAKQESADTASIKRNSSAGKTVLPENHEEMTGDQLMEWALRQGQ